MHHLLLLLLFISFSGWGSLGLYILENYPKCTVTCVSNSTTQKSYIEAASGAYQDRLKVITADVNVFSTTDQFDRIMSIEMFEHMKNYKSLFKKVSSWLKPDGLLFIQTFCHKQFPYAFDVKEGSDSEWMAKNFFTGGIMPSADLYLYFQEDLLIIDQWVINGSHYAKTLESWLTKLHQNKARVFEILKAAYGQAAKQHLFNWRLFFIFCAEVFGYKQGNEWHVINHLFKKHPKCSLWFWKWFSSLKQKSQVYFNDIKICRMNWIYIYIYIFFFFFLILIYVCTSV